MSGSVVILPTVSPGTITVSSYSVGRGSGFFDFVTEPQTLAELWKWFLYKKSLTITVKPTDTISLKIDSQQFTGVSYKTGSYKIVCSASSPGTYTFVPDVEEETLHSLWLKFLEKKKHAGV